MIPLNRLTFQHVARCWTSFFVIAAMSAQRGSAYQLDAEALAVMPSAQYAVSGGSQAHAGTVVTGARTPVSAFATEAGVYELDLATKTVRVWPRTAFGGELRDSRFGGVDASGSGTGFSNPKRMAKKPGANLIAVVDASIWNENLGMIPGVSFYEFEETTDSDGVLESVAFTFKGRFEHALLRYAEDVVFFPDGALFDFAVAATYEDVSTVTGDARQSWIVLGSGLENPAIADVFLAVRDKADYTNEEEVVSWPTTLAVDPTDASTLWAGSRSCSAVLRYDGPGGAYSEEVRHWTEEYNLYYGHRYVSSVDENDCCVADQVIGSLEDAGAAGRRMGAPGGLQMWDSPTGGKLLVVADTDNNRVVAFDEAGNERFVLGSEGAYKGHFTNPQGVWINDSGTEMVVADTGNGRVQVFSLEGVYVGPDESAVLSGFTTVEWEDLAETIARTNAVFYYESDVAARTNWFVAAAPGLTNRVYTVTASSSVPGALRLVTETIEIPAGETTAPIVFYALDGVEGGTECTISVGGIDGSFSISNAPPSLSTGTESSIAGPDPTFESFAYLEGAAAEASNAEFEVRTIGSTAAFHANAFDVSADEGSVSYEWRVVAVPRSAQYIVSAPAVYYTNVVTSGVPPTGTFVRLTEEEAAGLPDGENGGKLYCTTNVTADVSTSYVLDYSTGKYVQVVTTNVVEFVVSTNELFATTVVSTNSALAMATWGRLLLDGDDYAGNLVADFTLSGADVSFQVNSNNVYFAVLTATDKDGGSVRSLDTPDEFYWCFAGEGGNGPDPSQDPAVYSVVFTDVSGTNVTFVATLASGTPSSLDELSVQYAAALGGDWNPLFGFSPGTILESGGGPSVTAATLETGESAVVGIEPGASSVGVSIIYDAEPADGSRFYRVVKP